MPMKTTVTWIGGLIAIMWAVEVLNLVTGYSLSRSGGIQPRTLAGLIGIPASPFLHFSVFHLLMNTLPFAILGGLICLQDKKLFVEVSLIVIIVSGLAVWLLGRSAVHAGASALIFGYFGFLLASGWYAKDLQSILIALGVAVFYGGMIFGILPLRAYVSWEGHLSGLLAGILAAKLNARL
ncbi:MAG: rhomboid family intramembrane serine protease [Nitrospirota bacterium]|nr:rhomboid family intramembrane serine protease [Nitrospirota bacterium]